jgi:hypothetical protein
MAIAFSFINFFQKKWFLTRKATVKIDSAASVGGQEVNKIC